MKKLIILALSSIITLSIVGCTNSKPSIDEVMESINNGTLTYEDALEKGYINEEDLEMTESIKKEKGDSKLTGNMIGEFETTTLDGETFTTENLNSITYFAFVNPNSEVVAESLSILKQKYEEIKNAQGEVLIFTLDDENTEIFKDINIPVVHYNDSVKSALGDMASMINENGFVGTWNVTGALPMSWSKKIDTDDDFIKILNTLKDMISQSSESGTIEIPTVVD